MGHAIERAASVGDSVGCSTAAASENRRGAMALARAEDDRNQRYTSGTAASGESTRNVMLSCR
jgi:hypothetical protein